LRAEIYGARRSATSVLFSGVLLPNVALLSQSVKRYSGYAAEKRDFDGEVHAEFNGPADKPEPFPGAAAMTGADLGPMAGGPVAIAPEPRFLARRSFAGRPDQIRAARSWMAMLIEGFADASNAVLACSELAANAIIHSRSGLPGGSFTARACIDRDTIRIEIIDQGGQWTGVRKTQDEEEEEDDAGQSGRGLTIVAAIARSWGIGGDQEGRIAWCEINLSD
jgi:serine/threonine-protein kinase RsbW